MGVPEVVASRERCGESEDSAPDPRQAIAPSFGYVYSSGITTSLEGHGAQYTHYLANGWTLSGRVDYYWQDESDGRPFNRAMDRIDCWDVINLQVQLSGREERWFARAFVQNVEDDDNVTGLYSADEGSALFTNVFLVEPRLFGLTLGMRL